MVNNRIANCYLAHYHLIVFVFFTIKLCASVTFCVNVYHLSAFVIMCFCLWRQSYFLMSSLLESVACILCYNFVKCSFISSACLSDFFSLL